MREISFSKEKRANLQQQAYGKVYAYCNKCYLPLVPTSKTPTIEDKDKSFVARFIPCCLNGGTLFAEEYEINFFRRTSLESKESTA